MTTLFKTTLAVLALACIMSLLMPYSASESEGNSFYLSLFTALFIITPFVFGAGMLLTIIGLFKKQIKVLIGILLILLSSAIFILFYIGSIIMVLISG